MVSLFFGRKRKVPRKNKKPKASLLRLCKKLRVKTTKKVGGQKVYKSSSVLRRLCAKKAKKSPRRRRRARRSMGFGQLMGSPFENPSNYGYNQPVKQAQQVLSQSNTSSGVNREFFGQQVPTQIPPHWNFVGQPGGEAPVAIGSPHYIYPRPISAFGRPYRRRAKRMIVSSNPVCRRQKKKACKALKGTCVYKSGKDFYGCASAAQMLPYPWEAVASMGGVRTATNPNADLEAMFPTTSFGSLYRRRAKRMIVSSNPNCRRQKKKACKALKGTCVYKSGRRFYGCASKPKRLPYPWERAVQDFSMTQGEDMDGYLDTAGISFFGRRCRRKCAPNNRRYTKINSKSPCKNLKKSVCKSTPGCGYQRRKLRGNRDVRGCAKKPVYRKRMVSRAAGFGW